MSKKPRPMVPISVKIDPDLADGFYKLVNQEFGGNVSEAMREAIRLQISTTCVSHRRLSPELTDAFYKLVNEEFGGDPLKAVRAAVKLLISERFPSGLP